jgi:hypothetical protein
MDINDDIVKDYLEGKDISTFKGKWYFNNSSVAGDVGCNIFKEPIYSEEQIKKVKNVYCNLLEACIGFEPLNKIIWDALFPNWQEILHDVKVDLILGFPEPYDATTEYDDHGNCHIIFDLACWTKYLGNGDIKMVAKNLLTHELCHVLIGKSNPIIDQDYRSSNYNIALDALTFHEAFAHLVSYKSLEIDKVDWNESNLLKIRKKSNKEMRKALIAEKKKDQEDYLYRAQCGDYYDKYACMSGLLYLAELWKNGGVSALKNCFLDSYHGFADKCSKIEL